jgi:hypothetical protein
MAPASSIWRAALLAVGGALAATLSVRFLTLLLIDVPPEFPPLDGPGPTIFFTVAASLVAVGVHAFLRRTSRRPETVFRRVAAVVLLLSFVPDLWLLSDGAGEAFPGATPAGVGILMTLHIAAAAVIVWALTAGAPRQEPG